jgi:outer membrane protein assembly factor BamB
MSTDTDYVITIKGKDAALRKAAADFIELALNPWNPQRNDKKTLTRLDVFRNESNCAGFFAPSSLCEEAAKIFPGSDVSFSSKNEYGYTEEGEWAERGIEPDDLIAAVASKTFARIQAEVQTLQNKVDWLAPLAEWASENGAPKKTITAIRSALGEAEQAKKEAAAALEAEAEKAKQQEVEAEKHLESLVRWSFHPLITAKSSLLGAVGKPALWKCVNDDDSDSGYAWEPCDGELTANLDRAATEHWESVALGSPINPDSKSAAKFLESQLASKMEFEFSSRVFVRSKKGVEATRAKIVKRGASFVWLHSVSYVSNPSFKSEIKKALHVYKDLQDVSIWELADEDGLRGDKQDFGQDLEGCLAVTQGHAFFATSNASYDDAPVGRIYCVSLKDGSEQWVSQRTFLGCRALVASDESTLLAVCIEAGKQPCLLCLDALTGKERWHAPIDLSDRYFQIVASPEVASVLSYKTNEAGLSWWKVQSGHKVTEQSLPDAWSEPELAMDSLRTYVAGESSVTAFTAEGEHVWTVQQQKSRTFGLCLAGNNTLLNSRGDQGIVCLHCETGTTAWTIESDGMWAPHALVGGANIAYFAGAGACEARKISDGSLQWSVKTGDENVTTTPLAITDRAMLLKADHSRFEWRDLSSGEKLGDFGLSTSGNRSRRGDGVMAEDGTLVSIGSPRSGPRQLVCIDIGFGSPTGLWPMDGQGPGGASFLRLEQKQGYKQFIAAWKAKEDMSPRLACLGAATEDAKATAGRIHCIIRGHEMVAQAKLWAGPSIGAGDTAPLRGAQWRLVMAYGGFELLAKSLTTTKAGGLDDKAVDPLISKLSLPAFEPLAPPPIEKSTLKEWMDEEDASDVLDFLKMENGDRKRFDVWLAKKKPVETWTDAVLLAKSIRSATVHGALSPTKIDEWKIGEAVSRLTDEIFRLDEAVFEVLGKA